MDELVSLFHKFDVVPQSDSEDFQSKRIGREVAINTKSSSNGFIDDAGSNPSKGILHNVAAQVKAKLNVDMELQYITRDIAVNPRDLPLKETTLFLSWPEPYKTYGQGRSKKIAEHDAADRALHHLKSLNVVTEDGRLSIVCGGGKHGGERRRNHGRKRGDCDDGRKRKEDRRRNKEQDAGNWGSRSKEDQKDHHGGRSERGKCVYKEVDWWNKDGVAMDEEIDGDCEGDRPADEEEGVVEDWWDRASEEPIDGESKTGTKRMSLINSPGMEPSKRLCSRQDEEAAVGSRTSRIVEMKNSQLYVCKSSKVQSSMSGRRQLSIEESPPPHTRLRSSALGEEVDRLRKGLALGPLDDSFDTADLEKIQRQFPSCKNTLHNAFAAVAQEFRDPTLQPKPVYRPVQTLWPAKSWRSLKSNGFSGDGWECTYHLRWPEARSFSGEARAKAAAATQAALKALLWLRQQGRVTKEGNVNFSSAAAASAAVAFRHGEPETRPGKRETASSNGVSGGVTVVANLPPLDHSSMRESEKLLERFHQDVEPLLMEKKGPCRGSDSLHNYRRYTADEDDSTALSEDDGSSDVLGRGELSDPITGRRYRKPDERKVARRSEEMMQRIIQQREAEAGVGDGRMAMEFRRFRDIQENLPIAKFRQEIISLIEENRVVVVTGEAGCGKSTQVPQFILDDWAAHGRGGLCNIVVTQPRRISATSLAERVSHERLERVGDTVGYQVRLESRLPSSAISCGGGGGSILFCSVGILLRRLQTNPNLIGASHIILDEAHQRDVGTDVLATLLRRALAANPSLRLIVMSATLDAPLFAAFFGNAPTVHVPGFTYPVKDYYLEELENEVLHMRCCNGLHSSACEEESGGAIDFERLKQASERPNPVVDCEQVARVVRWVDSSRPPGGAVLVFLPGWAEIKAVASVLEKSPISSSMRCISNRLLILPVHSRLSYAEQRRIFDRAPAGTRKVIVATDVAETGITVDDVEYVVDTGAHREERFDAEKGVSCVDVHWASSASIRQRRGRAGRVRPGQAFHLFTRSRQEALLPYPLPEVHRVPLEKTVLDCKTYSRDMRAAEFLSEMPEPPPNDSVVQAVRELVALGALEEGPEERLTPLGRRIALFTTHPKLSKALVHAAIFRCVSPMVTIATVLSVEREPFQSALVDKAGVRSAKSHFCPTSDHLALSFMHEKWEETVNTRNSSISSESFCSTYGLSRDSMALIQSLRRIYAEHLYQSRLLPATENIDLEDDDDRDWRRRRTNGSSITTWSSWRRGRTNGMTAEDTFADRSARCNQLAMENELVLGVLLSGVGSILRRRQWDMRKGKVKKNAPTLVTDDGQRATLGSESVNNGRWGESRCPPFLTYFRQVRSQERKSILVREASLVSPILILLFANPQGRIYKVPRKGNDSSSQVSLVVQGKRELELHCDERQAQILVGLREAMWKVVDFFVREEGRTSVRDVHYQTILHFHERLLLLLPELLRSDPTVPKNLPLKEISDSRDSKASRNFLQHHYAEEQREIQSLMDVKEIRSLKCVSDVKNGRDGRSSNDFWSVKSARGARDLRERKALDRSKEIRESVYCRGMADLRDSRDCCEVKDSKGLRDWRSSRSEKNVLNWRDSKDWRNSRDCVDLNDTRDCRSVWESSNNGTAVANNAYSSDSRGIRYSREGDSRYTEGRDNGDLMEYKERLSRNGRDERMYHNGRESHGCRDNRYASDAWDVKNTKNLRVVKVLRGSRIVRDSNDCRESVDLREVSNGGNGYDFEDREDQINERECVDFREEIWDGKDVCGKRESCSNSLMLERSRYNSNKNRKINGTVKVKGDLCNELNGRRGTSDSFGVDHDCWRRHDSRDYVAMRDIPMERNLQDHLKAEKNVLEMKNPREQTNNVGKNGILGDVKPKDSYGEVRKSYEEMRDLRCSYRSKNGKDLSDCDVSLSSHDLYSSYAEVDLQGEDVKLFKDLRNSKCVEKSSMVHVTWREENGEEVRFRRDVFGEQMEVKDEVGDRKMKREISNKWSRKSSIGGH